MSPEAIDVRTALIRQWELLAAVVVELDLSEASRCSGWTNREVLAHLYVQPHLVARFLRTGGADRAVMGVTDNLAATSSYRELIDASARQGAALHKFDLRGPLDAVRPLVLSAPLQQTITTLQGPISVSDYLVTRCVEAVVHGRDLVPPVAPDPVAQRITSEALLDTLGVLSPTLVPAARALPIGQWIDLATGRASGTGPLAEAMPVMA